MELFTFMLGTIIGSFLNVCVYRLPLKQSITFPPSHCTKCNTRLKPLDLVPILSFLFAKERCKYCGAKISYQYPLVELLNGLIYLLLYIKFGFSMQSIGYSILSSTLIVIAIIDYYHQIIPDAINFFGVICGSIFHAVSFTNFSNLLQYLSGFLIGGGFLLLIAIITKGAMGGGDIKLMAVIGFWLGWQHTILTLFLSFLLGGIISSMLILFKLKARKDMIPFGPFIVFATIITIFYGTDIINYYIRNFVTY